MEQSISQSEATESPAKIPKFSVPSSAKTWVAVLFVVSLCLVAWGFIKSTSRQQSDDSLSRLILAVSRLMLADEVGVKDEVQRASDLLEQVLAERDSAESSVDSKETAEVFKLAGSVRDFLEKSNRKASVEAFLSFREKADALDSKIYRTKSQASGLNAATTAGLVGLLFSFAALWWLLERSSDTHKELLDDVQRSREEFESLKFRFEEEQRRAIDLQQRLMDMGKNSKRMESNLEEYSRAVAQLESGLKYLKTSQAETEAKLRTAEADLSGARRIRQEADLKISSLEALLNAAERTEQALESRLRALEAEKEEQYNHLTAKISELLAKRQVTLVEAPSSHLDFSEETAAGVPVDVVPVSNIDLPEDLDKMRSEMIQERARIQSEFAVIEWSNAKLKTEIDELKAELVASRAALAEQEKDARERMLTLENTLNQEKAQALEGASKQFEMEVKFLRDQLRAAMEQSGQRSA